MKLQCLGIELRELDALPGRSTIKAWKACTKSRDAAREDAGLCAWEESCLCACRKMHTPRGHAMTFGTQEVFASSSSSGLRVLDREALKGVLFRCTKKNKKQRVPGGKRGTKSGKTAFDGWIIGV